MAGPSPNTLSISKIKSNLLNLAQTSVYQVKLQPPSDVQNFLSQEGRNFSYLLNGESIELLCSDTNLPGSSLATHDVTNDYPGVTEKFAYRRIYDETIDFTFYVDSDYKVIEFLDGWINYITGQGTTFVNDRYVDKTRYYRMNYSNLYKTDGLYITKFEKDNRSSMTYQFIGAFPVNIVSMPVSYEASSILKCTASFSYIRYIRTRNRVSFVSAPQNPNSPANPELKTRPEQKGPAFDGNPYTINQKIPGAFSGGVLEGEELSNARTRRLTNFAGEPLF
jgi:hypothetical protein